LTHELVDRAQIIPSVIDAVNTRKLGLAKLSTGLVDAEILHLAGLAFFSRSRKGSAGQSGYRKKIVKKHC